MKYYVKAWFKRSKYHDSILKKTIWAEVKNDDNIKFLIKKFSQLLILIEACVFFFVGGGGFVDLFFFYSIYGETRFKFLYILTNIKMKNIENYNNHNNKNEWKRDYAVGVDCCRKIKNKKIGARKWSKFVFENKVAKELLYYDLMAADWFKSVKKMTEINLKKNK